MRVASLAPCRSNSLGISRSSASLCSFSAPCLANRSLCLLPRFSAWPLIHLKLVTVDLFLSRYAAFLKKGAFLTSVQPLSSQSPRWDVRPLMAYIKSIAIIIDWYLGIFSAAVIIAQISPIWFDCEVPGTLRAVFLWSFWPNQTLLLQIAFPFPLLKQAPLVYVVTSWIPLTCRCVRWQVAGKLEIFYGSMNILKHSVRSVLLVMDGPKVMCLLFFLACLFLAFLDSISKRLSLAGRLVSGFHFELICCNLIVASVAQSWGLRQFNSLSVLQSRQQQ